MTNCENSKQPEMSTAATSVSGTQWKLRLVLVLGQAAPNPGAAEQAAVTAFEAATTAGKTPAAASAAATAAAAAVPKGQ